MRSLPCLLALIVACSGDDAYKQSTIRRTAAQAPDPGSATPRDAAPAPAPAPIPLTEDMVAPYWTTADERLAAQQFGLEQWRPAMAAFEAQLAATPAGDDERSEPDQHNQYHRPFGHAR